MRKPAAVGGETRKGLEGERGRGGGKAAGTLSWMSPKQARANGTHVEAQLARAISCQHRVPEGPDGSTLRIWIHLNLCGMHRLSQSWIAGKDTNDGVDGGGNVAGAVGLTCRGARPHEPLMFMVP